MTEQLPENPPESTPTPTPRPSVRSGAWIGGAILITLGVVFLLQNLTGFELQNWWAIFILFPAVGTLERAYRIYQADGRLTSRARNPLLWGVAMVAVAVIFLVGGFGSWWPIFLVGAGLLLLVNGLLPD
jgi:hypothetical protein